MNNLEQLLQKIDKTVGKINTHPEYSTKLKKNLLSSIQRDSQRHSAQMERTDYKQIKSDLQNITKAWNYLSEVGIDLASIQKIGKLIEPSNKSENFRNIQVAYGGFYPPPAESLIYKVNNLVEFLKYEQNIHHIIKGIEAHVELVKIHPFEDGNGRAARLLSNFYLAQKSYPSYIIEDNEKKEYLSLLKNVLKQRYDLRSSIYEQTSEDRIFFEYIGEKILDSCNKIESALQKRRMYDVTLTKTKEPKQTVFYLKKHLHMYKKDLDKNLTIKTKTNCFQVTGDISHDELNQFMNKHKDIIHYKYRIKNITF